jgi:hypothetical protein
MSAWIDYLYPDALLGNPKALFVQYEPSDLDSSAPLFYLQTYPGYVDWNTNGWFVKKSGRNGINLISQVI